MLIALSACQQSASQTSSTYPVLYGEDTALGSVYWVDGCTSLLREVSDVVVTSGDTSNLEFVLKRNMMVAPTQCPSAQVPGAMVYVHAKQPVQTPQPVTVQYIVRYDTVNGPRTSTHTRNLILQPTAGVKAKVVN